MPNLEFDEENHIYRFNDQRLVSVTEALTLVDDRMKDPYYLKRGRYIHRACELWDRGELDESTVDPQILPRLEAWKVFRKDTGFVPDLIEQFFYHPLYLYGFKPDRTGSLNGDEALIDIKSSIHRLDALQGAAYWQGLKANRITCKKVFDLYLRDNGRYSLVKAENMKRDFQTFLAILTAYRYKEKL
jgi:hypothetical protein